MKRLIRSFIVVLLSVGIVYAAGSYAPNGYRYIPQLTTQGTTDYAQIVLSETATDAWMARRAAVYGDPGFTTLAAALATIGSTNTKLIIPSTATAVAVPAGVTTTIPANIQLQVDKGAYFVIPDASTLAINGPIEAGPYRIFSWTGTGAINVSGSPTEKFLLDWWGPTISPNPAAPTGDNGPIFQKALDGFGEGQTLFVRNGVWQVTTSVTHHSTEVGGTVVMGNIIEGEDRDGTFIYVNVGAANDGFTIGNPTSAFINMVFGMKIKNISFVGPPNCARYILNLANWNFGGGLERVNVWGGSVSYMIHALSCENGFWDVFHSNQQPYYAGLTGIANSKPAAGFHADGGDGSNHMRMHCSGGFVGAPILNVDAHSDWYVDDGSIFENSLLGKSGISSMDIAYSGRDKAYFSTTVTKLAQVFTVAAPTTVEEVAVSMGINGSVALPVTISLWSTAGGAPSAKVADCTPSFSSKYMVPDTGGADRGEYYTGKVRTGSIVLAAGQYAVVVECTPADTNVPWVQSSNPDTYSGGLGYYYDGSWHAATWIMGFTLNPGAAVEFNGAGHDAIASNHFENNIKDILVKNSYMIQVGSIYSNQIDVENSRDIELSAQGVRKLNIDPLSRATIKGGSVYESLYDYGDTTYLGGLHQVTGTTSGYEAQIPFNTKGNGGQTNFLPNVGMERWTASYPDGGWVNGTFDTWTQESSIVYQSRYSAKVETLGGTSTFFWNASSDILKAVAGNWVNWSVWVNVPAGDYGSTNYAFYGVVAKSLPNWANATAYNIGDMVLLPGSANAAIICVQAGTSGGVEPVPPANQGELVADGTNLTGCAWTKFADSLAFQVSNTFVGTGWNRVSSCSYVPRNATAVFAALNTWTEADTTVSTIYLADAAFVIGTVPPRGILPTATINYKEIGGTHIGADALIPTDGSSIYNGLWAAQGDVVWNTAAAAGGATASYWQCTVAGVNGTSSTWVAHPLP